MADVLVVIDMQNGVNSESEPLFRLEDVIHGINDRIASYREQNLPIIFIQHTGDGLPVGSKDFEIFADINISDNDIYVTKTHANSFFHTTLKEELDKLGVTSIEFCGAQTQFCVDTTIRFAHGLGYSLFMKQGLHTTTDNDLLSAETIMKHHESLWNRRFLTFI